MTDEHNNKNSSSSSTSNAINNNNDIGNSSSNNNEDNSASSERIIAEAAKICIKNGLNAAAAATLLTAFQLPAPPPLFTAGTSLPKVKTPTNSNNTETAANGLLYSNAAIASEISTAVLSSASSSRAMATATATTSALVAPKSGVSDIGVIDYTLSTANATAKSVANSLHKLTSSNHFDSGRQPISTASTNSSYGGRLQFFKDGKFILELARSKDGEKGGWVSVPRKSFRTPSAATSATVTPTSAAVTSYPKNENSTSLSFSDDNSSIQSSPWQRDHSWKQSRPRRGISKEMSLFYLRPKNIVLTKNGLETAAKKRRKPYLNTKTVHKLFERLDKSSSNKTFKDEGETLLSSEKIKTEPKTTKFDNDVNKNSKEEIESTTVNEASCKDNFTDCESKETLENLSTQNHIKIETMSSEDQTVENDSVEKMNTCEDEVVTTSDDVKTELQMEKTDLTKNGAEDKIDIENIPQPLVDTNKKDVDCLEANHKVGEVNTRLIKKRKPRAKLSKIIQKLIDNVPARLEQLSKTPVHSISGNGGGAITNLNHSLAHSKVSPPASAAATRLVEYPQQHVSPRKRILREFEKVSLEDNSANSSGAGGKRSRAKGGNITGSTSKSSPSRSPMQANPTPTTGSVGNNHITTGKSTTAASQPTRLNSSYSIHSLLGGSSGSSSASSSKKSHDQPATIISNVPQQQHTHYPNASYQRALLTSPKSPEAAGIGGGKSPSHVSNKKRSPPYASNSPMHESHSRSPTVAHDIGRRTPPDNYKLSLSQQHALHQTFYPPYAMSPQYVPAPGIAHSPTNTTRMTSSASSSSLSTTATLSSHIPHAASLLATRDLSPPRSSTASPREPATTPRTVPKKTASIRREFASPTASNSSTATSCPSPGDRSIASPERKFTSSTSQLSALQRGSPSSSAGSAAAAAGSPLHYYMYPPQSNGGTSPHTSSSSSIASQQPSSLATTSALSNSAASLAAAAAAAAYIPPGFSPYNPYISTLAALRHSPAWLNSYQTGLAPMVAPTHLHATTAASVAAGTRLGLPFHPFAYNGMGAAAVAAAAAAAAFGQSPQSAVTLQHHHHHQQQQQQHQQQHQQHLTEFASSSVERKNHAQKMTDINIETTSSGMSNNRLTSSPTATTAANNARAFSAPIAAVTTTAATTATATTSRTTHYHNNLREELSSDVPLNLSKH